MRSPSGSTQVVLQQLRRQSVYVADLCDNILLGGDTNRSNAMRLIHVAVLLLKERTERALVALESERAP